MRSRCGSMPRTPGVASCPRPAGSSPCAGRRGPPHSDRRGGRRCGSTLGWAGEARSAGGVAGGAEAGARFDPLLAKVIAVGSDRDDALARLAAALEEIELLGLATNLGFLRRLVRLPGVRA